MEDIYEILHSTNELDVTYKNAESAKKSCFLERREKQVMQSCIEYQKDKIDNLPKLEFQEKCTTHVCYLQEQSKNISR